MIEFNALLRAIPKILNVTLPGEAAHLKLSPPERAALLQKIDLTVHNPREASVVMLAYPHHDEARLALIRRNSYKGVHSSQVAFPGGKIEANETPQSAALRETEEEIGVPTSQIAVLRAFTPVYIPPSNFLVHPFLAVCHETPQFQPDPREVAEIVALRITDLMNDDNVRLHTMDTAYSRNIEVPALVVGDTVIWGATAMILSELKDVFSITLD